MPIRTRRHAGTLCVVVAQMVRRRRAFAGGVDADGGLKEKPPPLHETWGVMKLSSPQHAQNLLFLPIFDEQGRFFFHAACESTFSCSAGAVFLSLRSLDASDCEIGSASVRTLRTLVKPTTSLLGVWAVAGIGSTNSAGNSTGRRINTARKPCNSNAVTSWFERVATELHAKLVVDPAMRDARPGRASRRRAGYHQSTRPHWCGGRRRGRRAWLRCPWAVAGPGRASRRRAERSSRRGRLAGGPPPTGAQSSPA